MLLCNLLEGLSGLFRGSKSPGGTLIEDRDLNTVYSKVKRLCRL